MAQHIGNTHTKSNSFGASDSILDSSLGLVLTLDISGASLTLLSAFLTVLDFY